MLEFFYLHYRLLMGDKSSMNTIKQNAIYSIQLGIEDFQLANKGDNRRIISAARNIYAGILLLFKEKLVLESPSHDKELLIREKIIFEKDPSGNLLFKGAGKKTVDYKGIQDRFDNLSIQVDWKKLENIQKIRNDLEHYCTEKNEKQISKIISDTFIILNSFITKYLEEAPSNLLGEETWKYIVNQANMYHLLQKTWYAQVKKLNLSNRIIQENIYNIHCPRCDFDIFSTIPDHENEENPPIECVACNHEIQSSVYRQLVVEDLTPIPDHTDPDNLPTFVQCPECLQNTYLYDEDICLSCDKENLCNCSICGEKIERYLVNGNCENLCDNCSHMKYAMDKDD